MQCDAWNPCINLIGKPTRGLQGTGWCLAKVGLTATNATILSLQSFKISMEPCPKTFRTNDVQWNPWNPCSNLIGMPAGGLPGTGGCLSEVCIPASNITILTLWSPKIPMKPWKKSFMTSMLLKWYPIKPLELLYQPHWHAHSFLSGDGWVLVWGRCTSEQCHHPFSLEPWKTDGPTNKSIQDINSTPNGMQWNPWNPCSNFTGIPTGILMGTGEWLFTVGLPSSIQIYSASWLVHLDCVCIYISCVLNAIKTSTI